MVDLAPRLAPPGPLGNMGDLWKIAAVSRWPSNASQGDLSDAYSRRINFDLLKGGTLSLSIPGRSQQVAWLNALTSDLVAYRWDPNAGAFAPVFRGIINRSEDQISPTAHTVNLSAADYRAVLARRTLRDATSWGTATEQSTIIQALVTAGDQPRGYTSRLGLNYRLCNPDGSPLAATGITRTRAYLLGQQVASAIDDMATDINGFDWSVDPDLTDSSATGVVRMFYPYRGTSKSVWVAHYGSTVTDVARTVDATTYASYALTTGNASGLFAESFGAGWNDPVGHPEGAWMTVQAQSDVSVQATLQQNSDGIIAQYGSVLPSYTLTLAPGRWSPSDAWLGDIVRLIIVSGRLNVDTNVRITAVGIALDEQGRETVTLTANIPPLGAAELVRTIDRRLSRLERR